MALFGVCSTHTAGPAWLRLVFAPFTTDEQERCNDLEVFCVSPTRGVLEAREGDPPTSEVLQISFTARSVHRTGILLLFPVKPRCGWRSR